MAKSSTTSNPNQALLEKLEAARARGPAEVWRGEAEGDTIVGTFVGTHDTEIQGRMVTVADITDGDGKPRAILLSASMKGQVLSKGFKEGEQIGVVYLGQRKAGKGMTKLYAVEKG